MNECHYFDSSGRVGLGDVSSLKRREVLSAYIYIYIISCGLPLVYTSHTWLPYAAFGSRARVAGLW